MLLNVYGLYALCHSALWRGAKQQGGIRWWMLKATKSLEGEAEHNWDVRLHPKSKEDPLHQLPTCLWKC